MPNQLTGLLCCTGLGIIHGERFKRAGISRIDFTRLLSQFNRPSVGFRGSTLFPRGPSVSISQVAPEPVLLRFELSGFFECAGRFSISSIKEVNDGKIGI